MDPQKIEFKLTKIKTLQFATLAKDDLSPDLIASTGVTNSFDFKINKEKHSISVYCNIKFHLGPTPLVNLETCCEFTIQETSWNSLQRHGENKWVIPLAFAWTIATITVGTTRGILHAKTEDTGFNQLIVPAINLTNVITKDIEFN